MKIKIGQSGTQEEMLEKDKARLSEIHRAIGNVETSHTKNGKLPYYFDANGGYQKKETVLRLLDHTRKIGAFDQIALIEEPFPGLGIGLLETNGHQNYKKWQHMFSYHPYPNASWTKTKNGVFELDQKNKRDRALFKSFDFVSLAIYVSAFESVVCIFFLKEG